MSWWVYKCNSRKRDYQSAWGDWSEFFEGDPNQHWGSTDWVPALEQLRRGDMIIAYQTDRNELAGIAKVRQPCDVDTYLYLKPIESIGVKIRPLKKAKSKIAAIPVCGNIRTVITPMRPNNAFQPPGGARSGAGSCRLAFYRRPRRSAGVRVQQE